MAGCSENALLVDFWSEQEPISICAWFGLNRFVHRVPFSCCGTHEAFVRRHNGNQQPRGCSGIMRERGHM